LLGILILNFLGIKKEFLEGLILKGGLEGPIPVGGSGKWGLKALGLGWLGGRIVL